MAYSAPMDLMVECTLSEILQLYYKLNVTQRETILRNSNFSSIYDVIDNPSACNETYPERVACRYILLSVPPVLLLLGVCGNLFAFLILIQRGMRKCSTYAYLTVLALSDTLVLLLSLLPLWLEVLLQFRVTALATALCRITSALSYATSDYSVWLIVAVTCERYVAVCHPLRASSICSQQRATRVMILLGFIFVATNIHFLWTTDVVKRHPNSVPSCFAAPGYDQLLLEIWPWVDLCLYSIVPFTIILVLNVFIIRQLLAARKQRMTLQSAQARHNNAQSGRGGPEGNSRMTLMLLTVSFAFLITTLPIAVFNTVIAFKSGVDFTQLEEARLCLLQSVAKMLMFTNHSMNFYLYCATGHKFRQQFLRLIHIRRHQSLNQPSYHTQSTMATKLGRGALGDGKIELQDLKKHRKKHYEPVTTMGTDN